MSDNSDPFERPDRQRRGPFAAGLAGPGAAWIEDVRAAAAILTRLPEAWIKTARPVPPARSRDAVRAFPLVGAGLGLAGGLAFATAFTLAAPPLVAAFAALAVIAALGGGRREAGFAAAMAAIAGPRDGAPAGVESVAAILLIGLKAAALGAVLEADTGLFILIGAVGASQIAAPALAQLGTRGSLRRRLSGLGNEKPAAPAGDPGAEDDALIAEEDAADPTTAVLVAVALALVFLGPFAGAVALVAAAAAVFAFRAIVDASSNRDIPGLDDAAQQIAETALIVAAVAMT